VLGLAKTLPDAEAEQLLLQNLTVDTDDLRDWHKDVQILCAIISKMWRW
jgi:hypothetical protein